MKTVLRYYKLSIVLWLYIMALTSVSGAEPDVPRVFLLRGSTLRHVRQAVHADDPWFEKAMIALQRRADRALTQGPFSVTHKTGTPPSGDSHDYMSIGIYWWPNPDTPDGLPYVRHDGKVNPESRDGTYDANRNNQMVNAVSDLALAYYLTGHPPYAEHAADLLRTWFIDPETRMNPNLRYAQAWPGRNDGQGFGIIETASYVRLIDAPGLIAASEFWTTSDQQALQQWFADYLHWLKTSFNGLFAQFQPQNHGTWYDAQVLAYALFCDQQELAAAQVNTFSRQRLEVQFNDEGAQVNELTRTRSWSYSLYNLRAWFYLACLAEHVDSDLWNDRNDAGIGLQSALDFLIPHLDEPDAWPHPQIGRVGPGSLATVMLPLAIEVYDDPRYRQAYAAVEESTLSNPVRLRYAGHRFID